jgi:hypothetical protein
VVFVVVLQLLLVLDLCCCSLLPKECPSLLPPTTATQKLMLHLPLVVPSSS